MTFSFPIVYELSGVDINYAKLKFLIDTSPINVNKTAQINAFGTHNTTECMTDSSLFMRIKYSRLAAKTDDIVAIKCAPQM